MADNDKEISQLPEAGPLANNDLFVISQGGEAKKLTGQVINEKYAKPTAGIPLSDLNPSVFATQAEINAIKEAF